jgi:thioredoxin reductase/SAM-dependent methyltransferase
MTAEAETERRYDVVVIGGGAAGLSGALTLARARRTVLVVDGGRPRNAPADRVHTYLGSEGTSPQDLLARGRTEVAGYGGEVEDDTVVGVERTAQGAFRVVLGQGAVTADRLLVTTGLSDELPPVPGLRERWGRDVLHCPYCHGWEVRDQAIGILATGPLAVHQALLWRQWSEHVTFFQHTADEPGQEERRRLEARGIAVVHGTVTGLETVDDRLTGVRLDDGRVVLCDAITVTPRFAARAAVLDGLGVRTAEQEKDGHVVGTHVPAAPDGATEVPGVWAAGNVVNPFEQVIGAAAAGVRAGAAINADLVAEETARAVRSAEGAAPGGDAELWDARYRESDQIWSGNPNDALVREVASLTPGSALDLGCGEGADAIWLAEQGWRVTAADISAVALERAERHAARAGVVVGWQRHDLGASFPAGTFDLVCAQFLHSHGDLPRERILRMAAAAVAPGGVLLVVGHSGVAPWDHEHAHLELPTPQEVLESLQLAEGQWEVERSEEHPRTQVAPDGQTITRTDNTLRVRRRREPAVSR